MKRLLLLGVILSILSLSGCKTCESVEIILPADVPSPVLTGDDNQDMIILSVAFVRWKLKFNYARFIVGEIDKKTHDENRAALEALLLLD